MQEQELNDLTTTVAAQLGETEQIPIHQIRRVIRTLGPERAQQFVQQTLEVEAQGGMMLPDGSRRRTPGGVFFYLVRRNISWKEAAAIERTWVKQRQPPSSRKPQSTAPVNAPQPPPALPPFRIEVRRVVIQALKQHFGEATTVKVTLIGRPGHIVERQDLVITAMQNTKAPSLPRGVPTPPSTPTTYTVYIARKQWKTVAEAIADPDDSLIVEGFAAYDPELEGIAVYTTKVTTKKLQAAQRQTAVPAS